MYEIRKLPSISKIETPASVVGSKFFPYSMIGGCVLLAGYSLWPQPIKAEVEDMEEEDEN